MKTLTQLNKKNSFVACTSNQPSSIVILDPTVPDSNHIASGIKPGTATYILESQTDPCEQITTLLAQHTDIEALHIISHGGSGSLYLGTTELNSSNIQNYTQQLQQWRNSFTPNASIILYGCNSAAGERGHQFLTQLHQLTGANIAANPYPTGNSKKGGNRNNPHPTPPPPPPPPPPTNPPAPTPPPTPTPQATAKRAATGTSPNSSPHLPKHPNLPSQK